MPFYHRFTTAALTAALALVSSHTLSAQITKKWEVTWQMPSINNIDVPKRIDHLGKGNYVLATGRTIEITSDGGHSWKEIFNTTSIITGKGITDVAYAAPDHIVATFDSSYFGSAGEQSLSYVRTTTDGGKSWHRFNPAGNVRIVAVAMYDGQHGVIATITVGGSGDSLLKTNDGGMTWTPVPYPANVRFARDIHARGPNAWGMRARGMIEQQDFFYSTDDGGVTWKRSEEPMLDIKKVNFEGPDIAWAVGGAGAGVGDTQRDFIRKSTDGGVTWTTMLDSAINFRFGLTGIDFADELNGIAVGGYAKILRTTDGGNTWVQEWPLSELITEYITFMGIAYADVNEAITLGNYTRSLAYRGEQTLAAPRITEPADNSDNYPLTSTLSWTPIDGATHYDVQVGDTAYDYNYVAHAVFNDPYIEETGLTVTSLALELQPHVRYAIRVRARNAGMTGDWSVSRFVLTEGDAVVVAVPYFTAPEQGSIDQPLDVRLSWSPIPEAVGYDLTVAREMSFLVVHGIWENIQDTTFLVTDLLPGTTYYGRIRARNADGVTSVWSSQQTGILAFTTTSSSSVGGAEGIDFAASLYPNVATDHTDLMLLSSRSEEISVALVDMTGREVIRQRLSAPASGTHRHRIDLAGITPGRYIVSIERSVGRYELPLILVR